MKVTTDGCLLGAIVAERINNAKLITNDCLDIGAGTGLLSLMLAQKNNLLIDAVEIDEQSYLQAKENIERSAYKERINIFNSDINTFNAEKRYDYIISNPPFFEDDLRSVDANKNKAKHNASLTLVQLLKAIDDKLNEDGSFFVLLPYRRTAYFEKEAATFNFFLTEKIFVKQTPKHNFFRSILSFSRKETEPINSEITIKNEEGVYANEFAWLLKDYYLQQPVTSD
jgi:tRNA1Val (adenine37-N6)-methyltransferase